MRNQLLLPKHDTLTYNPPTFIIPIRNYKRKTDKQEDPVSKGQMEKKLPLFYTKPILKANKYDFL